MMNLEWIKKQHEELMAKDHPVETIEFNGETLNVYTWVPYETIEKAANEFAGLLVYEDDETGMLYILPYKNVFWYYIAMKYFTNFDVSEMSSVEDFKMLFDVMEATELIYKIDSSAGFYMMEARHLGEAIAEAAVRSHNDSRSIVVKASKWVEDVPANEDWMKELARSKEVNDAMVELIGKQKEESGEKVLGRGKVVDLKSFAKRK